MLNLGYQLSGQEHDPEHRLVLANESFLLRDFFHWALSSVLAVLVLWILYWMLPAIFTAETGGKALGLTIAALIGLGVPVVFLVFVGKGLSRTLRVEVDPDGITVTRSGFFPVWNRRDRYDVVQCTGVEFEAEMQQGASSGTCHLTVGHNEPDGEQRFFDLDFQMQVTDSEELRNVMFAWGRILRLGEFDLIRDDHRGLELEMFPVGYGESRLPFVDEHFTLRKRERSPKSGASTESGDVESGTTADSKDVEVESFSPGEFQPPLYVYRNTEIHWDPGTKVRLHVKGIPVQWIVLFAVIIGGIFGGIAYFAMGRPAGRELLYLVGASSMVALISGAYLYFYYPERKSLVDWRDNRIRVSEDGDEVEYAIDDVEKVELIGRDRQKSTTKGESYRHRMEYACEVRLRTRDKEKVTFAICRYFDDKEQPYQVMAPMANELARALGVPWKWLDY